MDSHASPRILFVLSVGLIATPVLREQLGFLKKSGIEVHVVAQRDAELQRVVEDNGATLHPWTVHRSYGSVRAEVVTVAHLARVVRSVRPDVIVAGTPKAGFLGVLVGRLFRHARIVYVMHGLRLEGATGALRVVLWIAEFISCRLAHDVQVVSRDLARRAAGLGLMPYERMTVVGSGSAAGINIRRFSPRSKPEKQELRNALGLPVGETPVVGFVGRITHDKGLPVLVHTARHLRDVCPNALLVLVGAVDPSDRRDEGLILELRSLANVRFLGHAVAIEDVYPALDVLVLPSLREGLPTVVLEAASCGVPAVLTRCTGAVDAVVDGQTGTTVDLGDADTFARSVESLALNEGRRELMGAHARARVIAEFDSGIVIPLLTDFYLRGLRQPDERVGRREW